MREYTGWVELRRIVENQILQDYVIKRSLIYFTEISEQIKCEHYHKVQLSQFIQQT